MISMVVFAGWTENLKRIRAIAIHTDIGMIVHFLNWLFVLIVFLAKWKFHKIEIIINNSLLTIKAIYLLMSIHNHSLMIDTGRESRSCGKHRWYGTYFRTRKELSSRYNRWQSWKRQSIEVFPSCLHSLWSFLVPFPSDSSQQILKFCQLLQLATASGLHDFDWIFLWRFIRVKVDVYLKFSFLFVIF